MDWIKKKKLPFQELDISESDTYRDDLLHKTSQIGVPVVEVDDIIVIGYNEQKLQDAIDKAMSK